jgi:mono/diheme cytochrome c family protein
MAGGKGRRLAAGVALAALAAPVFGQGPGEFPADRVKTGREIYSQTCAPCHGPRMEDPQVPMDLRKFPSAEKSRFVESVTKGKSQMPPFGGLFKPEEIEALWAYVMAGEKR